jgi:hypothetical protein
MISTRSLSKIATIIHSLRYAGRYIIASLVLFIAGTQVLSAQARAPQGGFRLQAGVAYGKPFLDSNLSLIWETLGTFGSGAGVGGGIGYDWSRVGVSLNLDDARTPIGEYHGSVFSLAASVHVMPTMRLRQWRPIATVGYVRQVIGGAGECGFVPPNLPVDCSVGIVGNGARLGIAFERTLRTHFAMRIGAEGDIVRFSTIVRDNLDMSFTPPGNAQQVRGVFTLIWRPF